MGPNHPLIWWLAAPPRTVVLGPTFRSIVFSHTDLVQVVWSTTQFDGTTSPTPTGSNAPHAPWRHTTGPATRNTSEEKQDDALW